MKLVTNLVLAESSDQKIDKNLFFSVILHLALREQETRILCVAQLLIKSLWQSSYSPDLTMAVRTGIKRTAHCGGEDHDSTWFGCF